jgi:hypothetical protein
MDALLIQSIFEGWDELKRGVDIQIKKENVEEVTLPSVVVDDSDEVTTLNELYLQYVRWAYLTRPVIYLIDGVHECDETCDMFPSILYDIDDDTSKKYNKHPEYIKLKSEVKLQNTLFICTRSGNLHHCTQTTCEYARPSRDRNEPGCPLTKKWYPCGVVMDRKEATDEDSGATIVVTDEMRKIASNSGRVTKNKAAVAANNQEWIKSEIERYNATDDAAPISVVNTTKNKNNKRRFAAINEISRWNDDRTKSLAQQQQQQQQLGTTTTTTAKRIRDVRPRHSMPIEQQQATAVGELKNRLKCVCGDGDHHIHKIAKHIRRLWWHIEQNDVYQTKGGGSGLYKYHEHCWIVMHHMTMGMMNQHKQVIVPKVKCLLPTPSTFFNHTKFSDINRRFMQYKEILSVDAFKELHASSSEIQ